MDADFLEVMTNLEAARTKMDALRNREGDPNWNKRALSIALTELETAQLWFANALEAA